MDKKNVQISFSQKSFRKILNLDHNENLASGQKKQKNKIVTINFFIFLKNDLGVFFHFHYMEIMEMNFTPKNAEFSCEICDFKCFKKSDWLRHVKTIKHSLSHDGNVLETAEMNFTPKNAKYYCQCGKKFKTNSGLWKHNTRDKKCKIDNKIDSQIETDDKNQLIMMLIKQNTELIKEQTNIKQMMIEQQNIVLEIAKNGTHNTTNSHNKSFNLQLFLNEKCKDAMNIMDFVDSIKLQLGDLEKVGKLGYVEGISNIITANLNALDVTQRPIHCTDKKREILYVKDENKWEKEDDEKKKLRRAIKRVALKNARLLSQFKEAHPDCNKSSSLYSDQYNKIIVESMGGPGNDDSEKEDKIIKNITKVTTIDKV